MKKNCYSAFRNLKAAVRMIVLAYFVQPLFCQEVWFEGNFSSPQWQQAFTSAGLPTEASAAVNIEDITGVDGIKVNGHYCYTDDLLCPCLENQQEFYPYAFRFRYANGANTYIEFPEVDGAGTLYLHVRNVSPETATRFIVQRWDETGWASVETFSSRPSQELDAFGTADELFSYNFNVPEGTPARIRVTKYPSDVRFLYIFKYRLERYSEGSDIHSVFTDHINAYVSGRIVYISSFKKGIRIELTDLSGRTVFVTEPDADRISLPDNLQKGIYLLKLSSGTEYLIKKVRIE